jgi:UDP-glucose 4-epimerase
MQCLVLGGGGFIGLNLCRALSEQGAKVKAFGLDISYPDALPSDVQFIKGEFSDLSLLATVVKGCDVVIHLISQTGVRIASSNRLAPIFTRDIVDTVNLLDICRAQGVEKLLFASSGGTVYGSHNGTNPISERAATAPISPYGVNKLAIEGILACFERECGLRHLSLRIGNPYGRYQSAVGRQGVVVAAFVHKALSGKDIEIWGNGEVVRDFLHVDDVVAAFMAGLRYEGDHHVMNVGSGVGKSIRDVAQDVIAGVARHPVNIRYLAASAADVPSVVLDTTLIRRELNWSPKIAWSDGLRDFIAWSAVQAAL